MGGIPISSIYTVYIIPDKKHLPIKHLKNVNIFLSFIITEICTLYVKRININKGFKKKKALH